MRKAEITLVTILFTVVTTLIGAFLEKEYGITVTIDKTLETNTTKEYPPIILTDK